MFLGMQLGPVKVQLCNVRRRVQHHHICSPAGSHLPPSQMAAGSIPVDGDEDQKLQPTSAASRRRASLVCRASTRAAFLPSRAFFTLPCWTSSKGLGLRKAPRGSAVAAVAAELSASCWMPCEHYAWAG